MFINRNNFFHICILLLALFDSSPVSIPKASVIAEKVVLTTSHILEKVLKKKVSISDPKSTSDDLLSSKKPFIADRVYLVLSATDNHIFHMTISILSFIFE